MIVKDIARPDPRTIRDLLAALSCQRRQEGGCALLESSLPTEKQMKNRCVKTWLDVQASQRKISDDSRSCIGSAPCIHFFVLLGSLTQGKSCHTRLNSISFSRNQLGRLLTGSIAPQKMIRDFSVRFKRRVAPLLVLMRVEEALSGATKFVLMDLPQGIVKRQSRQIVEGAV